MGCARKREPTRPANKDPIARTGTPLRHATTPVLPPSTEPTPFPQARATEYVEQTSTPEQITIALPIVVSDSSEPASTASVPSSAENAPDAATRTPTSTPSPTLPPPPQGGSKLGVHGIWANQIIDFARTAAEAGTPFRVVKAVDDVSWLKEIRTISPETITVARLTHDHEGAPNVNHPGTDLDGYARLLMEPILAKLQSDPALRQAVDYWELTNEPLGGGASAEAYARLAQVTAKSIAIAEEHGLRLAILGLNAGTPEWRDLVAMVETGLFSRARAGGHILAVHEGVFANDPIDKWWNTHSVDGEGNPTTVDTGHTAAGGWIPGAPVLPGAGALCLRYRFLYHLLEARGEVLPLFVSEFYAGGGYDHAAKTDVITRMHWYDEQLAKDDYVLGFAPFTLGPTEEWKLQDYGPIYAGSHGLIAYLTAISAPTP
jgi:hypothetical protein